MTATALALVVLAGLIHAIWNIAAKKAGGDVRFVAFTALLMVLLWAPLGLWLGWGAVPLWGAKQWALVTRERRGARALLHHRCCAATARST